MKKIIIFIVALLVGIAFMAYLYFSNLGLENNAKDLALQSATNNAALVFSFRNDKSFYEIIEAQDLLQQVLGEEKTILLKDLKKEFIDNSVINDYINDQNIYVSLLPDTNKTINFLITVQIQPGVDLKKLNGFIKSSKNISVVKANIFSITLRDSVQTYAHLNNRVITISTSLKLINNAAIRLSENPFTAYIKENNGTMKSALAQVYINFNQSPPLLKNILARNISGNLTVFNQQNSFASLSYNFSKERILFNGNTTLKNNLNYLKLFESSGAQNLTIQNILPDQTANYMIYAVDDYASFNLKFTEFLTGTKELAKTQNAIKQVKAEYRTDLNSIFPTYSKNQWVTFQLATAEKLAAVALTNGEKVKQLLIDISTDYSDDIKVFKSSNILYSYYGDPFRNFSKPFYTIIDNFLVVANHASTLQSFLNNYRNNKLLIESAEYRDAMNQIATTSNVSYYINLKKSSNIFRDEILSKYYLHLRADSGLKSFDTFCYQMISDKNKFITNVLLNKYTEQEVPDSLTNRL